MDVRASAARDGFAITPSDTVNHSTMAEAIYVGVGGDVVVVTVSGSVLTFKNAQAGSYILCESVRVNATGTTATNLIGLSY